MTRGHVWTELLLRCTVSILFVLMNDCLEFFVWRTVLTCSCGRVASLTWWVGFAVSPSQTGGFLPSTTASLGWILTLYDSITSDGLISFWVSECDLINSIKRSLVRLLALNVSVALWLVFLFLRKLKVREAASRKAFHLETRFQSNFATAQPSETPTNNSFCSCQPNRGVAFIMLQLHFKGSPSSQTSSERSTSLVYCSTERSQSRNHLQQLLLLAFTIFFYLNNQFVHREAGRLRSIKDYSHSLGCNSELKAAAAVALKSHFTPWNAAKMSHSTWLKPCRPLN